jgi:uncharacterized protein (DUF1499 family)
MSSVRRIAGMTLLHLLAVLVVAVLLVVFVVGRERVWQLAVGDPDLGHVDLSTVRKPSTPNTWLVAPLGQTQAEPDAVAPTFALPAADLFRVVNDLVAAEPLTQRVGFFPQVLEARYVQRTPLMRYPDTIIIKVYDIDAGRSTLALYSRSQIGHSDLGANRARLERWLKALANAAPPVGLAALPQP